MQALADEDLEAQTKVVTTTSEESPNASVNPWLPLATEEMRECVEKERMYKKSLQEKVLQKAAADAQDTLESRKRFLPSLHNATGEGTDAPQVQSVRPVVWGSAIYRGLWEKAANISDNVELEKESPPSPVVPNPFITDGASVTMSSDEQFVEQVSMMDVTTYEWYLKLRTQR
jgi:hypothetical protein